jgi:hypothetical protein
MLKILTAALVLGGAVLLTAPAPASAASRHDGITTAAQTDLSAARRHRRYRAARVYTYPTYGGVYPYGYYGPTYYERPYARPTPLFLGVGGYW